MTDETLFDSQPDPVRPYWQDDTPSAGYAAGVSTSKASEPHRLNSQQKTWLTARDAGGKGVTWRDIADTVGVHHGTASGALSVLHKRGHLARLSEERMGCKVYVLPSHVDGRDTEQPTVERESRKELARRAFAAGYAAAWRNLPRDSTFDTWWASQSET